MPLLMLRDGSIRRFKIVPEGLRTSIYRDRDHRTVHVVLDARGEEESSWPPEGDTGSISSLVADLSEAVMSR